MGRAPKLDHVRDSFLSALVSAETLHNDVQRVASVRPSPGRPTLHIKHSLRVSELAFMGMVSAWEDFLEQTTMRYLAGGKAGSGYAPQLRLSACSDIGHAYKVYSGMPKFDPTRDYLDWRVPTTVVDRAKVFFAGGHPYDGPLLLYAPRLKDALRLRDRSAHSSRKANDQFKEVARQLRGRALHQGYRVGDLLRSQCTGNFGFKAISSGKTVFEAYVGLYRDAAGRIVP